MAAQAQRLEGVFVAVPTPFEEDEVAEHRLARNIERWNEAGVDGYLVLGSTGEAVHLSAEERLAVVATAVGAAGGRPVIVGTGSQSGKETEELTQRAADLGAQAALVFPPHYYRAQMTEEVLAGYFRQLADQTRIPILAYNAPAYTGIALTPRLVAALAREDAIGGVKDSSGDLEAMVQTLAAVPPRFPFFVGTAAGVIAAAACGASGTIAALAAVLPGPLVRLWRLCREGKFGDAQALWRRLAPVHALVRAGGVAALKAAMDLAGWYGGDVRPPLAPVDPAGREALRAALAQATA